MPLYAVPPRLACWGDSLTLGLAPALTLPTTGRFRVENYGVGGETSAQILTRQSANTASHGWPTLIWAGSNDLPLHDPTSCLAHIASMVASLTSDYLILTPLNGENGSSYYVGGTIYGEMQTIIDGLNESYPGHVCDLRAFLVSQYNPSVAQDVTDHGHDIIPSSLRVDTIHLTPAGYALAAQYVAQFYLDAFTTPPTVIDLPVYPFVHTQGNRVGLGTDAPLARLHIDQDSAYGVFMGSNYKKHATAFITMGISGQSSGIINGDALGDACFMGNTPGRFRFSANNGGRTDLAIRNSDGGVELPNGILKLGTVSLTATQLASLIALLP